MDAKRLLKYRKTGVLPLAGKAILAIIRRYPKCFMLQETIAEEAGVCVRTVQRWLQFFEGEQLIVSRRTNRNNEYQAVTEQIRQNVVSESDKMSYPKATKCRIRKRQNVVSEHDILSPIVETPLYELLIHREECIDAQNAPSPAAPEMPNANQMPSEEGEDPRLVEWLKEHHAFDALPRFVIESIEADVRTFPAHTVDVVTFRRECVRVMIEWREDGRLDFELGWAEFKRLFIRDVPGKPSNDPECTYLQRVKEKFMPPGPFNAKGLNVTPAEMLEVLEMYLEDPERLAPKRGKVWEGTFPRQAYLVFPKYLKRIRARVFDKAAQEAHDKASAAKQPKTPDVEPIAAPPPSPIADAFTVALATALVELIGKSSVDGWFVGKTRFERNEQIVRLIVPSRFIADWLKEKFGKEIRQAVKTVTNLAALEYVIDANLFAARAQMPEATPQTAPVEPPPGDPPEIPFERSEPLPDKARRMQTAMGKFDMAGEQRDGKWNFHCQTWPDLAHQFADVEDAGPCVDEFERRAKRARGVKVDA